MQAYIVLLLMLTTQFSHAKTLTSYDLREVGHKNSKEVNLVNKEMIPASTTKLFTAIYALENLGADYRFETKLYYTGNVVNKELKGDLYLVGKADPMLLSRELMNFSMELKKRGIEKVSGFLYYDDTFLKSQKEVTSLGLIDRTDNPGVSALSVEFNRFRAEKNNNSYQPSPPLKILSLEKTSKDIPEHVEFYKFHNSQDHWSYLSNRKLKNKVSIPVKHPSSFTAHFLKLLSKYNGIEIKSVQKRSVPKQAKLIASQKSKTLIDLVDLNLEYSNNLMSELILLTTAKKKLNKAVTTLEASEDMKVWFSVFLNDKTFLQSKIYNGSGLDYRNRITTEHFVNLLEKIESKKYGQNFFKSILPISGSKGWLYNRISSPKYSFRVWAKTGSMDFSSAIAGYIQTQKNKTFAFSIITTDFELRKKVTEAQGKEKVNLMERAKKWKKHQVVQQDQLIKKWIEKY